MFTVGKLAKGITVMTTTIFSILVTDMLMLLVMVMVIAIAIVISMEVTGHSHFLTGVVFPSSLLGTLLKKNNGIFWEFFQNVGLPLLPPLLGTPVSKKKSVVYFAF